MPVKTKVKNKINKKSGHFICNLCDTDVVIGIIIKRLVYCLKCGEVMKGVR